MPKKLYGEGHARAYRAWFKESERLRKLQKLGPGRRPKGLPPPPTSPDELRRLMSEATVVVGESKALSILRIHRTTLKRWLSGETQAPESAALVLRLLGDGLHPAASDEWRGFRFDGDRLFLPDGRYYTAREIQGLPYQLAVIEAQRRQIADLEKKIAHLIKMGDFGAANDAVRLPAWRL